MAGMTCTKNDETHIARSKIDQAIVPEQEEDVAAGDSTTKEVHATTADESKPAPAEKEERKALVNGVEQTAGEKETADPDCLLSFLGTSCALTVLFHFPTDQWICKSRVLAKGSVQ